jgi:hypothetical protein
MEDYLCLDSHGHVIGRISADNGDIAWEFARIINPSVASLSPTIFSITARFTESLSKAA